MTTWDAAAGHERNRLVIEEFRANHESVDGREVVLLTTTGAKSGRPHTTPLLYLKQDDEVFLIASKGGSPTHPAWYYNLLANPTVTLEIGRERYEATARVLEGEERNRVYSAQVERYPFFGDYARVAGREIPVVALRRSDSGQHPAA